MKKTQCERREFLRLVVVGSTAAGLAPSLIGCSDGSGASRLSDAGMSAMDGGPNQAPDGADMDGGMPLEQGVVYPQGIASGDPQPESVILWTRVEPSDGMAEVDIRFEVSTDENFEGLVSSGDLTLDASTDHCLRLKVTDLDPYTVYYYRFESRNTVSMTGRTLTAPAVDADVEVRFAVASCQDFNGRQYHSWRALADEPQVDFVLFLGDYIYETARDARFQEAGGRSVTLPDGMNLNEDGSSQAAVSLADYRSLYRQYRSDPDLQRIHAMAPFVTVWDDHEFADDSWQHHATHFNESQGDEGDIERRTAASRAWYEYQPADVLYRQGNSFPEDMSIQRSLRFGRHCELFLTDLRSFRADHLVPEGPENTAVGKFNANSALGSRNFVLKNGFDALEQEAQPSMLGQEQKDWFLEGVLNSEATWKIWGNEVQTAQMLIDLSSFDMLPEEYRSSFYFSVDQWDGYRSERAGLLNALSGVENLVSLAGDIHAFYASELQVDFDAPADPVGVEYTVAGISSTPVQTITQRTVDGDELLQALGLGDLVPRFDELMQSASPHYRYAASNENGVGVATVSAESFEMTFLTVSDPTDIEYGGVIKRTQFRTPLGSNQVELV